MPRKETPSAAKAATTTGAKTTTTTKKATKTAEPTKAVKATTTTKKATTKATTAPATTTTTIPTKAEITEFVTKYFKPSTGANVPTKTVDPILDLYNYAPENYTFGADNGKSYKLKLLPPNVESSEKDQKAALISLLQLHSTWVRFTSEYNGSARIYCTITKKELIPSYADVKTFYSGPIFIREYKRSVAPVIDQRIAEAKRKLQEAAVAAVKKQKTNTTMQDKAAQKLVQLGVTNNSTDSDSDSSSSSSSSDDSDLDEDGEADYDSDDDREIEIKLAKKRAAYDATVDRRTGEKLAEFDSRGNKIQKKRWIVFVGNLAYTTRKKHLYKMFHKCDVLDVRLSTDKLTKQPKGCAFVEFGNPADIHHALGYDGHMLKGRKVNVELTAGGGGNTKARREKIETKRKQLAQEKIYRFGTDQ